MEVVIKMPETLKGVEARMVAVGKEVEVLIEKINDLKAKEFKSQTELNTLMKERELLIKEYGNLQKQGLINEYSY